MSLNFRNEPRSSTPLDSLIVGPRGTMLQQGRHMALWAAESWGDPTGEFLKGFGGGFPNSPRASFLNHDFWHARRDVTKLSKPFLECPPRVASQGPRGTVLQGRVGPTQVASQPGECATEGEAQNFVGCGILGDRAPGC